VSVVFCQVEVSASDRSLVQRIPTGCDMSECDREVFVMIRPWPTGRCRAIDGERLMVTSSALSIDISLSEEVKFKYLINYITYWTGKPIGKK
jgi:hypothetical protein